MLVGVVWVACTLRKGQAGWIDREGVALELVTAGAIEVTGIGTANRAGGVSRCYGAVLY